MTYFIRRNDDTTFYCDNMGSDYLTTTYYYVFSRENSAISGDGVNVNTTAIDLGTAGRFTFVRLASPSSGENIGTEWLSQGTYGILTENYKYQRYLNLVVPPSPTHSGLYVPLNQTGFRINMTPVNPNMLPPLSSRFRVWQNAADTNTFAFRCLDAAFVAAGTGIVTSVDIAANVGFYNGNTVSPTPPLNASFILDSQLGSGPVVPTPAATSTFTYFITGPIAGPPVTGYDFNFMQLRWTGSGIATEVGFSNTDVKTWVFEKVKSKINPTPDSIYSYKIRSLGSTANPAGYITCTASGITGDEFELLPHTGVFGAFTIRSVAHGNGLTKRFLKALIGGAAGFAVVTSPPSGGDFAWQLRPASNPFSVGDVKCPQKVAGSKRARDEE